MAVSGVAVNALHELLAGHLEEYRQRLQQLDQAEARHFSTIVNAAFLEAARERFIKDGTPASDEEVIDYVAWARSWADSTAQELDPKAGELLINVVIEKLPLAALDDLDGNTAFSGKLLLLATLIREAKLDEEGLAKFMERARETADMMLS
jgi:hypothetical protein